MMDAFIVILCNLLSFVENPSHPENSFVLRMIFRAIETIAKLAEFFFKKKHQINLIPIKNQMLFLLSRVVFKGTGKHDDFEGFMTCGTNDDMGDVETAIRDMTLSIWLVLNGETKEYFQKIKILPEEIKFDQINLDYVRYVACDLEIITSQISLFAQKSENLFEQSFNFLKLLDQFKDQSGVHGFLQEAESKVDSKVGEKFVTLDP